MDFQEAYHVLLSLAREAVGINGDTNPHNYSNAQVKIQEAEVEEASRIISKLTKAADNFISYVPTENDKLYIEKIILAIIPNTGDESSYENLYTKLRKPRNPKQLKTVLKSLAVSDTIGIDGHKGIAAAEVKYPHKITRL